MSRDGFNLEETGIVKLQRSIFFFTASFYFNSAPLRWTGRLWNFVYALSSRFSLTWVCTRLTFRYRSFVSVFQLNTKTFTTTNFMKVFLCNKKETESFKMSGNFSSYVYIRLIKCYTSKPKTFMVRIPVSSSTPATFQRNIIRSSDLLSIFTSTGYKTYFQ